MKNDNDKKILTLDEINEILSNTLLQLSERKISLKKATAISKMAMSLSKNIVNIELKDRIEFLEQRLKIKK